MKNKSFTIENDKKHIWNHSSQHKPLKTSNYMITDKDMDVTDINSKECLDTTLNSIIQEQKKARYTPFISDTTTSTKGLVSDYIAKLIVSLKIIKKKNLLKNIALVREYLLFKLFELKEKYNIIENIRDKLLLLGVNLVKDRKTREPMEKMFVANIVGYCLKNGVMIEKNK